MLCDKPFEDFMASPSNKDNEFLSNKDNGFLSNKSHLLMDHYNSHQKSNEESVIT